MIEFIRHALGLCGEGHSLVAALPILASLVLVVRVWRVRLARALRRVRR